MILYAQVRPITTQDTGLRVLVDGKDDEGNEALIEFVFLFFLPSLPSTPPSPTNLNKAS